MDKGCLQPLAVVHSAIMNVSMQISFQDLAFTSYGYILRSWIAGSYSSLNFNFVTNHHIVSIMIAPFYISTNSTQGFQVFHITTNTCFHFFSFWIVAILMDIKWCIPWWFWFPFPWLVMLSIFLCVFRTFIYHFWSNINYNFFWLFSSWVIWFFIEWWEFFLCVCIFPRY